MKVNLSIIFHLGTDRQSEIANQDMERHFYIFVNYQQNDWSKKLVMVKYAINNNELAFTKLSLFSAIKALYPYLSFDIVDFSNTSTHE